MPKLRLVQVVDVSSKDDKYPPENLLGNDLSSKWLSRNGEKSLSIHATFRLARPSIINRIDFGNAGSATVTVLVSRTGCKEFKELVPSSVICTEMDCLQGKGVTRTKLFTLNDLRKDTRHQQWDLLKVICCQPYRGMAGEQFGLSFMAVYGNCESGVKDSTTPGNELIKFKETALSSSRFPRKVEIKDIPHLSRADKMMLAVKPKSIPSSPVESNSKFDASDDIFRVKVISFLEANSKQQSTAAELRQQMEHQQEKPFTPMEKGRFMEIFRQYTSSSFSRKFQCGVLTPRINNRQLASPLSRVVQDTKSILKPQLHESFHALGRENVQTVYRAEVVHNRSLKDASVKYSGPSGKENSPFLLKKGILEDQDVITVDLCQATSPSKKSLASERKPYLDKQRSERVSPRESWKNCNDIDKSSPDQSSPDSWLKRKSDPLERSQPLSKKRSRSGSVGVAGSESLCTTRITPSGGWLLSNTGLNKTPHEAKTEDDVQFPFRVSPPPPPDRPSSPLPLVDDIDQPSTSSKETVAERNIRLELERRLAERSPPERVVQRTSSGKVKGTYCTKGMNTDDSPLRRLSICDEGDEVDSPQARRKLNFASQNGFQGETDVVVECPVCKGFFESSDINKHLDDCVPSPMKKPDDEDDMMACPICCLLVSKETVAAHADECAQKRYGA